MAVVEVTHPLVRHKVGLLREASLSTKSFREITAELGRLLTYEATADFPLEKSVVAGWAGPVAVERISGKKVTVVPILRAGLGMLEGVLDTIPNARVSVVGIARNHETLQPEPYIDRLAGNLEARTAIVLDPMLATGGSLAHTCNLLVERGATGTIIVVCVLAAPEGIELLRRSGLDLAIYTVLAPMMFLMLWRHSTSICIDRDAPFDPEQYIALQAETVLRGLCTPLSKDVS